MADATTAALRASDTITVIESFDALRIFLAMVWRRLGRDLEDIACLVADGTPVDGDVGGLARRDRGVQGGHGSDVIAGGQSTSGWPDARIFGRAISAEVAVRD